MSIEKNRLEKCKIVNFPKITDHRGNLTFIENDNHIPFDIKRVFYVYDIPTGETRGAHANYDLQELIICLSGSFDIFLDDGFNKKTFRMTRPWEGLFIPPLIWSSSGNYAPGTVYLVLANTKYDKSSYIRDYDTYQKVIREL